jgi:hypothetical protein
MSTDENNKVTEKSPIDIDKMQVQELINQISKLSKDVHVGHLKDLLHQAIKDRLYNVYGIDTSHRLFGEAREKNQVFNFNNGYDWNENRFLEFIRVNFAGDMDEFQTYDNISKLYDSHYFKYNDIGRYEWHYDTLTSVVDMLYGLITGQWQKNYHEANKIMEAAHKNPDGSITITIFKNVGNPDVIPSERWIKLRPYKNGRLDISGLTRDEEGRIKSALEAKRFLRPYPITEPYHHPSYPDYSFEKIAYYQWQYK